MRILILSAVFSNLLLSLVYSAPLESINSATNDKSIDTLVSNDAKSKTDEVPSSASKSSGSPEDRDAYRTHISQINSLLGYLKSSLSHRNKLTPSIAAPTLPVSTPLIGVSSQFGSPSYSNLQFLPPSGYGAPSWAGLSPDYYQSVPAISNSVPVFPAIYESTPGISAGPVGKPIPDISAPVNSLPAALPVGVPQTIFTKPVSEPAVQQPAYTISQQIIHKPVYTEVVEKIRRPIMTEVEQIVHKPVLTYLQQVIKRPLYAQHIVKPASYNQVSQLLYQAPLHLPGQSVHLVDKPVSQSIQLPTQVIKPVPTHGVGHGSYPSYGYGSMRPDYGLGGGYYGSSYGVGSDYGNLPYVYGSSYGSGYEYGGLSGASQGDGYYNYLIPSTCRTNGVCGRDSDGVYMTSNELMQVYLHHGVPHIRFLYFGEPSESSTVFERDFFNMLKNKKFRHRYFHLVKNYWPKKEIFDEDIMTRLKNEEFKNDFIKLVKETLLKVDTSSGKEETLDDVDLIPNLENDKFRNEFVKLMRETLLQVDTDSGSLETKIILDAFVEKLRKLSGKKPDKWSKIFNPEDERKIESTETETQN